MIQKLAHELRRLHPAGFYTEEIRGDGQRQGFRIVGLNGSEGILSHIDFRDCPRVGRYGVAIDRFGDFPEAQNLEEADAPLVIIDDIGKMECLYRSFIRQFSTGRSGAQRLKKCNSRVSKRLRISIDVRGK